MYFFYFFIALRTNSAYTTQKGAFKLDLRPHSITKLSVKGENNMFFVFLYSLQNLNDTLEL